MDTSRLCHTLFGNLLCVIFVYDLSLFFHFYAFKFVRRQTKVVKKSFCSVVCVRIVSICGRGVCVLLAFPCLCSRDWNGCCRGFPYGVLYLYLSSSYLEWQVVINFPTASFFSHQTTTLRIWAQRASRQAVTRVGLRSASIHTASFWIQETGGSLIRCNILQKISAEVTIPNRFSFFIFIFFVLYVIMSTILW